jgi:hypothetical protein
MQSDERNDAGFSRIEACSRPLAFVLDVAEARHGRHVLLLLLLFNSATCAINSRSVNAALIQTEYTFIGASGQDS